MKNYFPSREQVEKLKEMYPKGTRICLNSMSDPYAPVESGMEGVVTCVDDVGTVHTKWRNGRTLGLVVDEDSFSVISTPEQEHDQTIGGMGGQS